MKKSLPVVFFLVLVLSGASLVSANSINIEFPSGNEFAAGESITFKVTLQDDSGKPLDGQIQITLEDAQKKRVLRTVLSKDIVTMDLGEDISSGQGVITATSGETKSIAFFEVGREESVIFELDGNNLIVTNTGNTVYSRTIQITIGETTGTQEPNLEIGESVTYRLIAPDGNYNIRITDGKTTLTRGGVGLTGTGNVIGAIDSSVSTRSPLTGVTNPDQGNELALISSLRQNRFVYVFVAVIFGAMILIAIERRYKRNAGG